MWAMMAISMGMAVYGTEKAVLQRRAVGRYNEELLKNKAKLTEYAMQSETTRGHEEARRLKGAQAAAAAKSGAITSEGTPLLVLAEQSGLMEKDILENRRNRLIEAQGLRQAGEMEWYNARQEARAIRLAGMQSSMSMGMGGGGGGGKSNTGTVLTSGTANQQYYGSSLNKYNTGRGYDYA